MPVIAVDHKQVCGVPFSRFLISRHSELRKFFFLLIFLTDGVSCGAGCFNRDTSGGKSCVNWGTRVITNGNIQLLIVVPFQVVLTVFLFVHHMIHICRSRGIGRIYCYIPVQISFQILPIKSKRHSSISDLPRE
jgi:hypothetical protein